MNSCGVWVKLKATVQRVVRGTGVCTQVYTYMERSCSHSKTVCVPGTGTRVALMLSYSTHFAFCIEIHDIHTYIHT
jgi:hypothetical protein